MNTFSVWTPQAPASVGIVLLRSDGTFYNFTTMGWDAASAAGMPPASANILVLSRPITTGIFNGNWFGQFGDVSSNLAELVTIPVSLDAAGVPVAQLDQYAVQWLNFATGTGGGYSRGLSGGFIKTG